DAMGGLASVKDFLAEDYVLGGTFRKAGKKVVISGSPVDNVNVYRTPRQFLSRHARWNRMRFSIAGAGYFAELFTNPVGLSLLMVAAALVGIGAIVAVSPALRLYVVQWFEQFRQWLFDLKGLL
ncbi:MAG: glycosyltransferase, partial [Actinomycetota bacterium]